MNKFLFANIVNSSCVKTEAFLLSIDTFLLTTINSALNKPFEGVNNGRMSLEKQNAAKMMLMPVSAAKA